MEKRARSLKKKKKKGYTSSTPHSPRKTKNRMQRTVHLQWPCLVSHGLGFVSSLCMGREGGGAGGGLTEIKEKKRRSPCDHDT